MKGMLYSICDRNEHTNSSVLLEDNNGEIIPRWNETDGSARPSFVMCTFSWGQGRGGMSLSGKTDGRRSRYDFLL